MSKQGWYLILDVRKANFLFTLQTMFSTIYTFYYQQVSYLLISVCILSYVLFLVLSVIIFYNTLYIECLNCYYRNVLIFFSLHTEMDVNRCTNVV